MTTELNNKKIAILSTNGFEQSELEQPLNELRDKGATVHVIAPESGDVKGWKDGNWGDSFPVDHTITEAFGRVDEYFSEKCSS